MGESAKDALWRAARTVWRRLARITGWILHVVTWPVRVWWRAMRAARWPRRVALAAAGAVVLLVGWLAVAVPWPGYLFTPPFRAVEYGLMNDLQYLRPAVNADGEATWQGWTEKDRLRFYHHPQGSAQVMLAKMRYAWFINLEVAGGREKFADPANMARFGFLTDIHQQPDANWNPGNLPVGFTKYYDDRAGAELLDFTCSLCHTGELHYRGTAIRILGGQAMHAVTDMKPGQFQAGMMAALLATYLNPWKFDRFAHAVIDPRLVAGTAQDFDFSDAKSNLHAELGTTIRRLLADAWTDLRHGNYPVFEGYGRTDATQRIANTVFGRHISPDNYRPATAPVSYPHLWDIWKFNWVQWEGYASQPMARNVNESLGVGARLELFDEFGAPLPPALRYETSIQPDHLHAIERTLATLEAPAWPEALFGTIKMEKARKGRALFDVNCRHCHGPHVDPADVQPEVYARDANIGVPLKYHADGTCTLTVRDAPNAGTTGPGRDVRLTPQQCLNLQNPQRVADMDGRAVFKLDDAGTVIGLACDPSREDCRNRPDHVPEWRLSLLPIRDIGTDRHAALNFAWNTYDASRLGWTPDELRELCLSEDAIKNIEPRKMSAVVGLNIMSLSIARRYFRRHPPANADELRRYMGFGILDFPRTDPARLENYKSRPLHGIWATPPFLHNGSVRTVYQMISPREERDLWFWSGTREYDPVHMGYLNKDVPGAVRYDTRTIGNDNTGHEFRQGCQKSGVIGRYLEPQERVEILEYLKVMDYTPGDVGYEPALCPYRTDEEKAACFAEIDRAAAEERQKNPAWGTPEFKNTTAERHCSDDDLIYGTHLPPTPGPDEVWDTWKMAANAQCSTYRKLLMSEDLPGDN